MFFKGSTSRVPDITQLPSAVNTTQFQHEKAFIGMASVIAIILPLVVGILVKNCWPQRGKHEAGILSWVFVGLVWRGLRTNVPLGTWDVSSGLHACITRALPTEPSSYPPNTDVLTSLAGSSIYLVFYSDTKYWMKWASKCLMCHATAMTLAMYSLQKHLQWNFHTIIRTSHFTLSHFPSCIMQLNGC